MYTIKYFNQLTPRQKDRCINLILNSNGGQPGSEYHNDVFNKLRTKGQKVTTMKGEKWYTPKPVNWDDFKPENILKSK